MAEYQETMFEKKKEPNKVEDLPYDSRLSGIQKAIQQFDKEIKAFN
jgi:hypothetical protein